MQNSQSSAKNMLNRIEPKTKAARIKAMHGEIESKIKSGVQLAQIVEALNAMGLDINLVTLKSYLYRLRKKSNPALPSSTEYSFEAKGPETKTSAPSSTVLQDIDSILNQDAVNQAHELARYERLAKSNRRKP